MGQRWIKLEDHRDSPEIIHIAETMGVDTFGALGRVAAFWLYADSKASVDDGGDATLKLMTASRLDATYGEGFSESMQDAGWLVLNGKDAILPGYGEHNGTTARERADSSLRKRRERDRKRASKEGDEGGSEPLFGDEKPVTENRDTTVTCVTEKSPCHTTEERRGDKRYTNPPNPLPADAARGDLGGGVASDGSEEKSPPAAVCLEVAAVATSCGGVGLKDYKIALPAALRDAGFDTNCKQSVDRGDGTEGRIDVMATRGEDRVAVCVCRGLPSVEAQVKLRNADATRRVLVVIKPKAECPASVDEAITLVRVTPSPPPKIEFPASLRTETFRDACTRWFRHRNDIGKRFSHEAIRLQLLDLEQLGETEAISRINHSIKQGWTGIYPPKDSAGRNGPPPVNGDYRKSLPKT